MWTDRRGAQRSGGTLGWRRTQDPWVTGLARQVLGRVARAEGVQSEAAQHLERSLATFMEMPAKLEAGQTRLHLADLAWSQGYRERAMSLFGEAARGFAALRVPYWEEQTRRLATRCGVTTPS